MQKNETTNKKQTGTEKWENSVFCGMEDYRQMQSCCGDEAQKDRCCSMMKKGMKGCRWFALIPLVFGGALLLLGYYLDAEITRILWMLTAGSVALLGILGFILAGRIKNVCCG